MINVMKLKAYSHQEEKIMTNLKCMMKLSENTRKAFERQKENIVKFQKSILCYLLFNMFFVVPIFLLNEKFISYMPKVYVILMIFYYLFKLTYFHIGLSIFSSIFNVIFNVIFLKYDIKKLVFSFVIIISDIALNIYWLQNGGIWTIQ